MDVIHDTYSTSTMKWIENELFKYPGRYKESNMYRVHESQRGLNPENSPTHLQHTIPHESRFYFPSGPERAQFWAVAQTRSW